MEISANKIEGLKWKSVPIKLKAQQRNNLRKSSRESKFFCYGFAGKQHDGDDDSG